MIMKISGMLLYLFIIGAFYIGVVMYFQSQYIHMSVNVSYYEKQIADLRRENQELEQKIEYYSSLKYVQEVAPTFGYK